MLKKKQGSEVDRELALDSQDSGVQFLPDQSGTAMLNKSLNL